MYSNRYGVRGIGQDRVTPNDPVGAAAGPGCGLPAPRPAPPGSPGAMAGQKYCRSHLGNEINIPAGATRTITLTPTNAVEFVARWCHITASSDGVSPVTFTQAFTIESTTILGDNQLAANTPVIGSTWSAQQTYLEVFWDRVITAVNPLSLEIRNLDPALDINVFVSVSGDFVKS